MGSCHPKQRCFIVSFCFIPRRGIAWHLLSRYQPVFCAFGALTTVGDGTRILITIHRDQCERLPKMYDRVGELCLLRAICIKILYEMKGVKCIRCVGHIYWGTDGQQGVWGRLMLLLLIVLYHGGLSENRHGCLTWLCWYLRELYGSVPSMTECPVDNLDEGGLRPQHQDLTSIGEGY
jgi:hypothetical protein